MDLGNGAAACGKETGRSSPPATTCMHPHCRVTLAARLDCDTAELMDVQLHAGRTQQPYRLPAHGRRPPALVDVPLRRGLSAVCDGLAPIRLAPDQWCRARTPSAIMPDGAEAVRCGFFDVCVEGLILTLSWYCAYRCCRMWMPVAADAARLLRPIQQPRCVPWRPTAHHTRCNPRMKLHRS